MQAANKGAFEAKKTAESIGLSIYLPNEKTKMNILQKFNI